MSDNEQQQTARPTLSDIPDEPSDWLLGSLDWLIRFASRVLVLLIALGVLYAAFLLAFGSDGARQKILTVIEALGTHWQALPMLLIPLFYLPLRRLIYRAKVFGDNPEHAQQLPAPPQGGTATQIGPGTAS